MFKSTSACNSLIKRKQEENVHSDHDQTERIGQRQHYLVASISGVYSVGDHWSREHFQYSIITSGQVFILQKVSRNYR